MFVELFLSAIPAFIWTLGFTTLFLLWFSFLYYGHYGPLVDVRGYWNFQTHLNFLRVKISRDFYSFLTSFLHSYFNDTCVLFFSSSSCKNSGSSRVSLGQGCSGLQLKGSVLSIDHHKFTEAIKSIIPAIQSLEMRISPKPTFKMKTRKYFKRGLWLQLVSDSVTYCSL